MGSYDIVDVETGDLIVVDLNVAVAIAAVHAYSLDGRKVKAVQAPAHNMAVQANSQGIPQIFSQT